MFFQVINFISSLELYIGHYLGFVTLLMYARSAASRSARRNTIDPVFAECVLSPFIIITAATVSVNLNSGDYRVNQRISKGSSSAMTCRFAGVHFIFFLIDGVSRIA